jgi:hypothetical protein
MRRSILPTWNPLRSWSNISVHGDNYPYETQVSRY